ncbi:unnamed protein product [Cylicocyclus nassatus]|uniref:Uncharacterized protein n=1 Tax=Cylicocyclus nassatus TaxID=53992 RepID=A0AA36DJ63_CYLNA|nr:unnamed protein product [Cylicocyclus nassatus]
MALHDYVELASTAVFLASTALNVFFIYIVHTKTKQDLGMYKYVMIWFAIGNIAYSLAEFISKPTIHIYSNSYMTISRSFMRRYKEWGFVSLYVFISMYGANTAILALHFICRYIIICKHSWMFLIEKTRYIIMWVTIVFFWGFTYGFIAYYCFAPTEHFFNYARASVRERFNEKIEDMPFFAVFVYEVIAGELIVHWKCCIGLAIIITMMLTTLTVMISTGFIMVTTLKKVTMSEKTKMLQTQLLKALLFQATVPFLLSYLPRFLMFAFVIKGYPSHKIYTFVPVMITSYTCLDPLAVMYFIHDYREAVHTLFHCDDHALTKNLWVASYSRLSYRQQSSV